LNSRNFFSELKRRNVYKVAALARPIVERSVAMMYVLLGDNETPIATLSDVVDSGELPTRAHLRFAPIWDPLRKDPRFVKLAAKPQSK
jgi:hypothetical protein